MQLHYTQITGEIMGKSTEYQAMDYYRRFSGIAEAEELSKMSQISFRLPTHQLEQIDLMAKHFGQTRSAFLMDTLHGALDDFYIAYIEQCYDNDDAEACNAFLGALGHKQEAKAIFKQMQGNGGKLS
jgi:predicted DNA-binding protein